MAIYSLHHQPVGKSTQARPHTSAAHVRYITRPSATSRIEAGRMPDAPGKAAVFMVEGENADRKNARVSDKVMVALPRELDAEQQAQLVRGFAEEVTRGRAPWLAAFHDKGKDAHNPHAHLIIRDRDPATGKRVAGLSDKGSTKRLRALWEAHANRALGRAGRSERIDRRTLEAQGIPRNPTVHEGPKAQQMERRRARPESRMRRYRNRPGARSPYRDVDYRPIDGGHSRPGYNRRVRMQESEADYWEALRADDLRRELEQLRQIHLQHRPDLMEFPLVARRAVKPGQTSNDARPGVGARRSFPKLEPHEQGLPSLLQHKHADLPFEAQPPQNGQSLNFKHGLMYGNLPGKDKEKMARHDDDDSPEARWKANDAKKRDLDGTFDHLLDNSYDDKEQALNKMGAFRDKHGSDALFHALRTEPDSFGSPPQDPAKAANAPRYRKELAPTFNDYGQAHDEGDRLKRTHGDRPQGLSEPTQGQERPSGLSSLWNRPQPGSSPTGGAGGIPQGNPQLRPSSYPLESPFRAESGQKQPSNSVRPHKLPSAEEVDDPWSAKPRQERNPLSLRSPAPAKGRQGDGPKIQAPAPEPGRHLLSLRSPALPKAASVPPMSPPQALGREAMKTPLERPVGYKRKGLDDGM